MPPFLRSANRGGISHESIVVVEALPEKEAIHTADQLG